jgi:hypothetical protein
MSMTDNEHEREKQVIEIAALNNFDMRPYSLALEIKQFLQFRKDEGTSIDSGTFSGEADLNVQIDGREYFITIRASARQVSDDTQKLRGS